jgi:LacI family transcriptional regulator
MTVLSDGDERQIWFDHITSRGTRGLLLLISALTRAQHEELQARRLPYVVIDPSAEPAPGARSVGVTNWAGGLMATRHLIELGHQRIAVISGPAGVLCSRARVDGYRAALESAGIRVDTSLVRSGDFRPGGGYAQGKSLLSLKDPPTAIFAGSDLQAMGTIEAARELGLRVPLELSVVGFDDLPMSQWFSPPLTTVRQPLREMGALAVQMLQRAASREDLGNPHVELATELVVRESTAPPSSRSGSTDKHVRSRAVARAAKSAAV